VIGPDQDLKHQKNRCADDAHTLGCSALIRSTLTMSRLVRRASII
jgi:hypothetical protein